MKAFKLLGFVRRVTNNFTDESALVHLYTSLIRSKLEDASIVWSPCYDKYISALQRVQDKFLKFARWRNFNVKLQSLEQRRQISDSMFLYKLLNNQISSPELVECISLRQPVSTTGLRNNHLFHFQFSPTNYRRNSPLRRIVRNFNLLSEKNVSIDIFFDSQFVFKNKITRIISP